MLLLILYRLYALSAGGGEVLRASIRSLFLNALHPRLSEMTDAALPSPTRTSVLGFE